MKILEINLKKIIFLFFTVPIVSLADSEIYSWVDSSGVKHYSTKSKKKSDTPIKLPFLVKENISLKIKKIREKAKKTCEPHGGIDCSLKKDKDGSVICEDGFRDSLEPFIFHCLETKLKPNSITLIDKKNKQRTFAFSNTKDLKNIKEIKKIIFSIRNISSIKAYDVNIGIRQNRNKTINIKGSKDIEGYGLKDYSLNLDEKLRQKDLGKIIKNLRITCANCR